MDGLRAVAASVRRWAFGPTARALLPLVLICLIGPLGELADAALVSEMEIELLASDLGVEMAATLFLFGYQLVALLLAGAWLLGGLALIRGDGPLPVPVLVSCAPRPLAKIPIR